MATAFCQTHARVVRSLKEEEEDPTKKREKSWWSFQLSCSLVLRERSRRGALSKSCAAIVQAPARRKEWSRRSRRRKLGEEEAGNIPTGADDDVDDDQSGATKALSQDDLTRGEGGKIFCDKGEAHLAKEDIKKKGSERKCSKQSIPPFSLSVSLQQRKLDKDGYPSLPPPPPLVNWLCNQCAP